MQTTDQLTQAMGSLALNSAHQPGHDEGSDTTTQHLLTFDFPAIDLVEDKLQVYFPEPHLVDWRPRPQALMFHLGMWDPKSLFYTMDSTGPNCDISEVDSEKAAQFLTSVVLLGKSNGSTTMSIVVHVQNGDPEVRIRLSTTLDGSNQVKTTFWDLDTNDWEAIMALAEPWVEVLRDVVYRKTTRSFLAAEETLERHCPVLHRGDNKQWADRWGSGSASTAKTLLIKYLRHLSSDRVLPFDNLEEDGGTIQLPCGHTINITKEQIDSSTEAECLNAECIFCHARILPAAQYEEAMMCEQQYKVYEASDRADAWTGLDREITDSRVRPVSKTALLAAISAAIDSLQLPEIVESTHMAPASFPQTAAALCGLNNRLENKAEIFQQSPMSLAFDLAGVSVSIVEGEKLGIPPTWTKFMKIALTRAVNLATVRRCSKTSGGHEGVHMHGRKVFVSVPYGMAGDEAFGMGDLREALDVEMDTD